MDFYAINSDFFEFGIPSVLSLMVNPEKAMDIQDQSDMNRIIDGLFASVMATRTCPLIKYQKQSDISYRIASQLNDRLFSSDYDFTMKETQGSPPTTLLILDRREDPITPLLN